MMAALLLAGLLGMPDGELSGLAGAERAYRAGRYAEALALFQAALLEPGTPQGPVLYNLGNCAYRLGRHAEAVLCYRRARLRLPRDPEVEFNLRMAERELGISRPARDGPGARLLALVDSLLPGEIALLLGGLQCVGLAGMVLLRRRRGARLGMALLVLVALAGAGCLVYTRWFSPRVAVVLDGRIRLRTEPHAAMPVTLTLKAGELVRVQELSDRWARVEHPRGGGWTERAGVGVID